MAPVEACVGPNTYRDGRVGLTRRGSRPQGRNACVTRDAQSGKAHCHACARHLSHRFTTSECCLTQSRFTRCVPTSTVVLYIRCARTLQPICHRRISISRSLGRQLSGGSSCPAGGKPFGAGLRASCPPAEAAAVPGRWRGWRHGGAYKDATPLSP